MRCVGMRGIFSGIVAWAAIVLLFFSASSGLYLEQNDKTLLKTQVSRELSETTDNMVRWLDKAAAEDYFNFKDRQGNCKGGNIKNWPFTNFNAAVGKAMSPYSCSVGTPTFDDDTSGGQTDMLTVSGTVTCEITLGSTKLTEPRGVTFRKVAKDLGPGADCIVYDNISKCKEWPQPFDPACDNQP